MRVRRSICNLYFFLNDTATTEIYTLSLHDALPISITGVGVFTDEVVQDDIDRIYRVLATPALTRQELQCCADRKSTRLNSSHSQISYAVFCLKKKTTYSYICTDLHARNIR